MKKFQHYRLAALGLFLAAASRASASTGGAGLPWEGALSKIQKSLSGPVAMSISLIAIFVAGGMLIFGGELGDFARKVIMLVLVLALLVAGNSFVELLFTTGGALLGGL